MSWTDIFPHLSDDAIEEYEDLVSESEREELAHFFRIASWHNKVESAPAHLVAASLFWKPAESGDADFPELTRDVLADPSAYGITARIGNPWEHYVAPLILGARDLKLQRPDVAFRVYLANDLEFLVPYLVQVGCEVALMESSSLRHNPGAMWRFLAMEEECLVTITDSDRAWYVIHDVERTEIAAEAGIGFWRVPYTWGEEATKKGLPSHYRPVLASQFGSTSRYEVEKLMKAFIWHSRRGTIADHIDFGNDARMEIFGTLWPTYGFDEWFLLAGLYPRIAMNGIATFIPWSDRSLRHWFALDIEYCTWANPLSEIFYHGDALPAEDTDPESGEKKEEGAAVADGSSGVLVER